MNSVIEKVTLYDFFGYLIPGLTFLLLAWAGPVAEYEELQELIKSNTGTVVSVSLLAGFVCGIILSEAFRLVCDICAYIMKKYFLKKGKVRKDELAAIEEATGINKEILQKAIECSGYTRRCAGSGKILSVMYGNIQSDERYKRIHNYASSEVLGKNLAAAVLTGGLTEGLWMRMSGDLVLPGSTLCMISVIWICIFLLLIRRYRKFKRKKECYAVIWFVQKYAAEPECKNKSEAACD